MTWLNAQIERTFEALGIFTFKHAAWVLCALLVFLGGVVSQLPKLTIDTSSEGMLHRDDPVRTDYDAFREQFGSDEIIVVGVRAPDEIDQPFLETFGSLQREIEKVSYVKEVTSLINARSTRGEAGELIVEDYLGEGPEGYADAPQKIREAVDNPLYRNQYISEDGKWLAIVVETDALLDPSASDEALVFDDAEAPLASEDSSMVFLSADQRAEVVTELTGILDAYRSPSLPIVVSGSTVILEAFNRRTLGDAGITMGAASLVVIFFLVLFFRRLSGVVLPFLVVQLSVFTTLGLMAFFGSPFTSATHALFPFLYAVGIGDAMHILTLFYRRFEENGDKGEAIAYALGHSGPAVLLTSLTTAGGLLSFSLAELSSIAALGIYIATAVMLALIYTLLLLPSLLAIFPIRANVNNKRTSAMTDRSLERIASFSCNNARPIFAVAVILLVVSFIPIREIRFSNDTLSYFGETETLRTDAMTIDEELGGAGVLEVIVDTRQENGLYDPAFLRDIDEAVRQTRELTHRSYPATAIETVASVTDVLRETHRALNENDPAFYRLPETREAIAQELLLFESSGSDDLERLVDSQLSRARISMKIPYADGVVYYDIIRDVEAIFQNTLGDRAQITLTGNMALVARSIPKAMHSMTKSYVAAFIIVTLLMILLVGDWKIGLLSMFPNVLPIALVLGIMGASSTPLDMTTIMIGSIAIGMVVDDTLHFMYSFRRYLGKSGDVRRSVRETFQSSGRAMLYTSLILCGAFGSNMLATLSNVTRFGLFLALTVAFALLADFLVSPALVILFTKRAPSRASSREEIVCELEPMSD